MLLFEDKEEWLEEMEKDLDTSSSLIRSQDRVSYSVPYLFRKYHYGDFVHYTTNTMDSQSSSNGIVSSSPKTRMNFSPSARQKQDKGATSHVLCNESSIEPNFGFQLPYDYLQQLVSEIEKSLYSWRLFSEAERKNRSITQG